MRFAVLISFFAAIPRMVFGGMEEFSRLEYIDTAGKEWIDTGLKAKGNLTVEAKLQAFAAGFCGAWSGSSAFGLNAPRYALFGGGDSPSNNVIMVNVACWRSVVPEPVSWYAGESSADLIGEMADNYVQSPVVWRPSVYTYDRERKGAGTVSLKLDTSGTIAYHSKYHTTSTFVSTNNFYIAAANVGDASFSRPGIMRIWYFKIWDVTNPGELLRDFIPCRRNSDGAVGLYDNVEGRFYPNSSGEGALIAGPLVVDEYVSSDDNTFRYGAQWTLSGYAGTSTISGVPVLLRISEESVPGFHYSRCLENGEDIAFSSKEDFSDRLPCEIDEWNRNGTSLVWVKVPSVSGKNTKIYMRWGRKTPAGNLPSSEVWSDYLGVYHMSKFDSERKTTPDSSPHARHAVLVSRGEDSPTPTVTLVEGAQGKVGKAIKVEDGLLEIASPTSFPDKYDDMPLHFSVSVWLRLEYDTYDGWRDQLGHFDNLTPEGSTTKYRYGWMFQNDSAKNYSALYYGKNGSSGRNIKAWWKVSETEWHHRVVSSNGYLISPYSDGTKYISETYKNEKTDDGIPHKGGADIGGIDKPISIGGKTMTQVTDEVRISRSVLSDDRVKADYGMMVNESFAVCSPAELLIDGFKITVR